MGNMELPCTQCRGIGPHLPAWGKSHGCCRVAAVTYGIFSSFSGDNSSKLVFVQRHQDSCLLMRDTTKSPQCFAGNFEASRRETGDPSFISICHIDMGFLSVFNKSQASFPFVALKFACISRCPKDVSPSVQRSGD